MIESVGNGSTCPICNQGKLIIGGPFITCCVCEKMWLAHEFLSTWRRAVEERQAEASSLEAAR